MKSELRARLLAARRAVPAEVRAAEADALTAALTDFLRGRQTVCAYVPVASEPGSPALLDALRDAGLRVLLPVTLADQPLQWAEYTPGGLVKAGFGLLEPEGPRLAPKVIGQADAFIVPALAVDRHGVRLGRGAGFYDRSLSLRSPNAELIAVVRDEEFVDALPAEPHDVPMTHVATPGGGVRALGP